MRSGRRQNSNQVSDLKEKSNRWKWKWKWNKQISHRTDTTMERNCNADEKNYPEQHGTEEEIR